MQELFAKYGSTGIIVVVWIAIFYFLIIRPNKKKQKQQQDLLNSLKEGTEVITIGGIKGTIAFVGEDYVEIRVDKGVKLTFRKSAIANVINNNQQEKRQKLVVFIIDNFSMEYFYS